MNTKGLKGLLLVIAGLAQWLLETLGWGVPFTRAFMISVGAVVMFYGFRQIADRNDK
jgi:hypothetical protein